MVGSKLRVVMAREYVERVRSKWFLIATIFGPLLFGAVLYLPPWLASRSRASADIARIIILDATGTPLGKRVAVQLNGGITGDTSLTEIRAVPSLRLAEAESAATRATIARRVRGYLVLDSATMQGVRARYAGANATSTADMARLEQVVRQETTVLRLEQAGVDPATSEALTRNRLELEAERITERGRGASARLSLYLAFTVALLLYMSILLYGQAVLRSVIDEKQSRVAEVVVSSVAPRTLLGGKVLGVGAVGLTQLVIWVGAGLALTKLRAPILMRLGIQAISGGTPDVPVGLALVLLLFFVLGYTFYAALFAAVGATVSNEQDAQQAQMPIIVLLVMSVALLAPILASPESTLAYALGWLPFSAPIVMPMRMSVVSLSPVDIGGSIVLLACSCYVAVWVAARVYRVGLLMYGKRATFAETLRWIRRSG